MKKKKILIFISSLGGGGAQRVISILLKNMKRENIVIKLVLLKRAGAFLDYIPEEIEIIDLKSLKARNAIIKIIKLINFEKPDIVLSTLGYLNLIVILSKYFVNNKIKYIGRESNIPSLKNKQLKPPWLYNMLYKLFYNRFAYIICQSMDMKDDLLKNYAIEENKLVVINNPVDFAFIQGKLSGNPVELTRDTFNIIAAGKLNSQKGFDLLVSAFSKIKIVNKRLYIMGSGEEKNNLQDLAVKLGISHQILFLGYVDNPYPYMAHADVFVLSSRYEGFPNVVLEAMACGTQVVAFDCPGGIDEIIEHGENGWLVPGQDTNALAETIEFASINPLSKKVIKETIMSRFNAEIIVRRYEMLFQQVLEI